MVRIYHWGRRPVDLHGDGGTKDLRVRRQAARRRRRAQVAWESCSRATTTAHNTALAPAHAHTPLLPHTRVLRMFREDTRQQPPPVDSLCNYLHSTYLVRISLAMYLSMCLTYDIFGFLYFSSNSMLVEFWIPTREYTFKLQILFGSRVTFYTFALDKVATSQFNTTLTSVSSSSNATLTCRFQLK